MDEVIVNPLVLNLKKPFTFESVEYISIDLSKFEDWTADDLIAVKKKFKKLNGEFEGGVEVILPQTNDDYIKFLASEASGLPFDLFGKMPSQNFEAMRTLIIGFFLG